MRSWSLGIESSLLSWRAASQSEQELSHFPSFLYRSPALSLLFSQSWRWLRFKPGYDFNPHKLDPRLSFVSLQIVAVQRHLRESTTVDARPFQMFETEERSEEALYIYIYIYSPYHKRRFALKLRSEVLILTHF